MAPGESGPLRSVGPLDTRSRAWEAPCVAVSKRLLLTLALLSLAFGVASWIIEGITPSWVVFPIFLVVGLVRSRKGGAYGIVWLGVSALVFLLVHLHSTRQRSRSTVSTQRAPTTLAIASSGSFLSVSCRF